jgi:hypothetical protein
MMDLFARRGMYPYGVADLVRWAQTGEDPAHEQGEATGPRRKV